MIITRTIPPNTINVSGLVYEMLIAFPTQFDDLLFYREDNNVDNFNINVSSWASPADDIILDALIANHNPALARFALNADKYSTYILPAPFATNSQIFQLAFSFNFPADSDWDFELGWLQHISIANNTQQGEFEFRLNGAPLFTSRIGIRNNTREPYGGVYPIAPVFGINLFEIYIRKVSGNALITLQDAVITTKYEDK